MSNDRTYICIDLKSFYASVECAERGLDPFTTNLVVADPDRSKGTICLAITPAMKALGVHNRCRVYEIPEGLEYITAVPRMQLYIDYSAHIYNTYLHYISRDDIHVYSIDECFLDVTDYLKLYHLTAREMALTLIGAVMQETGITSSAGIGTNLYLAKIAMDISAKHRDDHIGILDEYSYRKSLWDHRPLTDFWQLGSGTQRTLARYGIYTMGDIARMSLTHDEFLYRLFGINAELLIDHAWGYEPCTMKEIHSYRTKSSSLSSGQVLMRNYSFDEALVILREMTDQLILELVEKALETDTISLAISYDHRAGLCSCHKSMKLRTHTSSAYKILPAMESVYYEIADRYTGIRRICIAFSRLIPEGCMQLDLFTDPYLLEKEKSVQNACISIRERFGKNAILKGSNLLSCSTVRERHSQIGGHRA